MKKYYIYLFIIILFSNCIEPFDISIDKYENLLVFDGMITDEKGPYTIKLSRSSPTDGVDFNYVTGATVIISDNAGNSETLSETDNGIYSTSENGIQGVTNNFYKVYIKTAEGIEYESEYRELLPAIGIDTLYGQVDFQSTDNTNLMHEGYQYFIKTETLSSDSNYFMWEPIETYQYFAEYKIDYYYYDGEVHQFPNPDSVYTCWKTSRIQDIYVLSTQNNNNFVQFALNFTSADTKKLSVGYSLLVKQYRINQEAFQYWNKLKKLLYKGQTLYNIQPFQITGNIKNINDPEEVVLGYFTVAGTTEKRIFSRTIQPSIYVPSTCEPNTLRWARTLMYGSSIVVYGVIVSENGAVGAIGGSCIFCTNKGGTITRPDFWF